MNVPRDDLIDFTVDESIGDDVRVLLLIKGFNQEAVVERIVQRKGVRAHGLTAARNAADRRYATGEIVSTRLDRPHLDQHTLAGSGWSLRCFEPFDVAICRETLAYTNGSEVSILDLIDGESRNIQHDWLSFAHTAEFSADGTRLLVASAGFDTVLEFDVSTGASTWEWNAWDHGINRVALDRTYVSRESEQASELERMGHRVRLIDDPDVLPAEGLPTSESPARLNGAAYDSHDRILLSFYHLPQLAVVERSSSYRLIEGDLDHPHGFKRTSLPGHTGYLVTNSGKGRLSFLSSDFEPVEHLLFTSLPADPKKAQTFGEWIQTVNVLDSSRGLLAAVDSLRNGVHLVDLSKRKRRFLPNPPNWRLHAVLPAPPTVPFRCPS